MTEARLVDQPAQPLDLSAPSEEFPGGPVLGHASPTLVFAPPLPNTRPRPTARGSTRDIHVREGRRVMRGSSCPG
jgi:hypothetical protein